MELDTVRLHRWCVVCPDRDVYPWKLILFFDGATELFNLADDPGEQENLSFELPNLLEKMRPRLEEYEASTKPVAPFDQGGLELDHDTRKALTALGYVQ